MESKHMKRWWMAALLVMSACTAAAQSATQSAQTPAVGWLTLPAQAEAGEVTVFYPSAGPEQTVRRGPFRFQLGQGTPALAGNGRLVVISHGSGGGPWVHMDLSRRLVAAGYVVAVPWHKGDNHQDDGTPGPESWERRPAEVSAAIDAVARDARLAPLLQVDRVGVYGQSAGGHTALSLAGGVWSPGNFRRHCDAHIAEDFNACVGLATHLRGNWLDGPKLWLARAVLNSYFDDDQPRSHQDPRVAAVVAGVPAAADFDMATLQQPRIPLGLVLAGQDRWLQPRFHGERVRAACQSCELLGDLPGGGHSIGLSPLPPGLQGLEALLLADPPGFDRAALLPEVDGRIVGFFDRHLRR
jgi:predicted dienelactone hydrolase